MPVTIAAGTGKAFNQAFLDRIDPGAPHNNQNSLGRSLGRLDAPGPFAVTMISTLRRTSSAGKLSEPIDFSIRISVLGGDVLSFYVAVARAEPFRIAPALAGLTSWIERLIIYPVRWTFFGCCA